MGMQYPGPGQSFRGFDGGYRGGNKYYAVKAALGTTPTLVKWGAGRIAQITNTIATAQSGTITLYDYADATNYASGQKLFTITPGASSTQPNPTPLDITFDFGLVIVCSVAVSADVLIQFV